MIHYFDFDSVRFGKKSGISLLAMRNVHVAEIKRILLIYYMSVLCALITSSDFDSARQSCWSEP